MAIEVVKEKYSQAINAVVIGNARTIVIGGETALPFMFDEGAIPNAPVAALEVLDCVPEDWADALKEAFGRAIDDPVVWAKRGAEMTGCGALCVRLQSIHPDWGSRPVSRSIEVLKDIVRSCSLPLIVIGSGDDEKDNDALPKVSQALAGERCLLGIATQGNYKTLAATCLADGHALIAESPIDVNIAKQVNILIGDMGFDVKNIVMHPTTTSLGYGMEYVYSIMERSRLAAFTGDRMLSMPFILFPGQETWKTKEAREYGSRQGVNWEIATAISMIQAGGDLIVMRHPEALRAITAYVDALMKR